MKNTLIALFVSILCLNGVPLSQANDNIIRDGEYEFLRQQHGERWDAEDKEIDALLSEIRNKNGGKRPNILYILLDDVSFGQMGTPPAPERRPPASRSSVGCGSPLVGEGWDCPWIETRRPERRRSSFAGSLP